MQAQQLKHARLLLKNKLSKKLHLESFSKKNKGSCGNLSDSKESSNWAFR